mmetsp:Transcript_128148/g.190962  ORF Transcript_128148/g.190962 Transcript_128148/m.190962 type:complete len:99 (+) Transcript_128148:468-764(+)
MSWNGCPPKEMACYSQHVTLMFPFLYFLDVLPESSHESGIIDVVSAPIQDKHLRESLCNSTCQVGENIVASIGYSGFTLAWILNMIALINFGSVLVEL